MDRIKLLNDLIECNLPLQPIKEELSSFSWDSPELVTLKKEHIISVLSRYIEGLISSEELETWADTIECREDIRYHDNDDIINEKIYILATPILHGAMNKAKALNMINELGK